MVGGLAAAAARLDAPPPFFSLSYASGTPLSHLDGVPYAVIDALDALGHRTTAGTAFLGETRPVARDAPCVAALRSAGAVLLGKANCHEAGVGMTGLNPHWGTPRNPHDGGRHAGGSSSGSAAAVAAGVAAFALGLDGGGSVRVPAALCGVASLRPTVGRTARDGAPPTASTIMAVGAIAPTVGDAAIVHAVIANAGTEGAVPRPPPATVPAAAGRGARGAASSSLPLAGVRVGVFPAWNADVAPGVGAAMRGGLDALVAAGAEVTGEGVERASDDGVSPQLAAHPPPLLSSSPSPCPNWSWCGAPRLRRSRPSSRRPTPPRSRTPPPGAASRPRPASRSPPRLG